MRWNRVLLTAAVCAAIGSVAYGELQNVTLGGNIRIRGSWYAGGHNHGAVLGIPGKQTSFIEQRTRLSAKADFTNDVSGVIELDSWDVWGEDFRASGLTGIDGRAASVDDVEIYQSYIDAKKILGTDLSVRVGRQELQYGNEWLVGNNDTASLFRGLSFDALKLSYGNEDYNVDIFGAKLADTLGKAFEKDTNFYGVYATVHGGLINDKLKDTTIEAYYLLLNDDGPLASKIVAGRLMDIHTLGVRVAGKIDKFDYNAEGAYQIGYIGRTGARDLSYRGWGTNNELGYTFDVKTNPRVYAGFAMFTGADDKGHQLSFNRLFSDWEYTEFFENTDLSNAMIYRLGASVAPREDLNVQLALSYFMVHDESNAFRSDGNTSRNLGLETGLYVTYNYSKDLTIRSGYIHFWSMEGIKDGRGNLLQGNGLIKINAPSLDDADYVFLEGELTF